VAGVDRSGRLKVWELTDRAKENLIAAQSEGTHKRRKKALDESAQLSGVTAPQNRH